MCDRSQSVSVSSFKSAAMGTLGGVSQELSISPMLFNVFESPLAAQMHSFGFKMISYANDTQIILNVSVDKYEDQVTFKL